MLIINQSNATMSNAASDLSITFDLLPHPIHAASAYVRWLLLGATRFRTFLDCSIAQLRDVLVQKVIQQLALAAVALTLSRAQADACVHNGFVGDSVDPRHIKITFQGILLRDDVILQVPPPSRAPRIAFVRSWFVFLSPRCQQSTFSKEGFVFTFSKEGFVFVSLLPQFHLTRSTSTGAP